MKPGEQHARATRLLALHHRPDVLVLPNAWDVATARIFAAAGADAVATTSGGIAAALGHPDGEQVPSEAMLAMITRIAGAVTVPVTADIESGYANTSEGVATLIRAVLEAGAVGVNLEDADHHHAGPFVDIELHVAKIRAARGAADRAGIPLVINARTDVFLAAAGPQEGRLPCAIRRANAYLDAGADSAFVPGVRDAKTVASLAREVEGPLNILAGPGVPPVADLQALGVARVSVGSGPARAALALVQRIAHELLERGTYEAFSDQQLSQDDIAALLAPDSSLPPSQAASARPQQ